MADSVVTALLNYLSGLLTDEPNFLAGVEDQVNSLQVELSVVSQLLKKSEGRQNDEKVKEIVQQIREVAYEAEDVIDSFILKHAEFGGRSAIERIVHVRPMLQKVETKIVGIKEKINKIFNNQERYMYSVVATVNAFEEEAIQRRWIEVKEDDVEGFVHDSTSGLYKTISLRYADLHSQLKLCFLYFSIYPKDFEIPVKQLIHMWVAEGFIQQTDHRSPEDVAEIYLKELVDRSLIQVATWRADGGVKTCRIDALLQDFCISMSAEENFLMVCSDNHFCANKCRRLSIQGSARQYFSAGPFNPTNARSLFFLGQHTYSFDANRWTWVLEKFRLLRVLNFGRVNLYSIPTRIVKLVHLRYLTIESATLRAIPASIDNLLNLETLDMRGTFLECLPKGIWKLRRLKNLYMSGPVSFPDDLDADVTALDNLHVLSTVSLNQQTLSPIFKGKLPNVRKLGLWLDESNSGAADVLECLKRLRQLQRVKVINWSHCPLRNLFPSTINKITLRQVSLKDGRGMSELGKLPNLQILKLQSCLLSSELQVFPGTFPQLEVFKLENLMIKEWRQEGHAMPFLKHLSIKKCIELTVLPLEVQRSTALQYVEVVCGNPKLAKMLEELHIQVGFRLQLDPPLDADFYEKAAALNIY